ncbi:cupredoxin domain-containing protein [Mesobacterium pallidum]|uniref:cupredoxin domain-containing protein n=1 Tax=Mesobacterium pallidum TaxID=2872037 RepID=UPI001EE3315B|nr:cupredoxin family protein [Mesobacterium pallidum]
MKTALLAMGLTLAASIVPAVVLASPGHGNGQMAVGMPAMHGEKPARTVTVILREDYDGDRPFVFEPSDLTFAAGETVRLMITNKGEETHEFVMDTVDKNAEHRDLMAKFPEMEHDDPNAVRLEPGEEAEIIWTFNNSGTFEFACLLPGHYEGGMYGSLIVE